MKTVEPVSQKMIEEVKTEIDQHLEEKQLRKKYESDQRYYVMLADVDRNKVEKTQSDDAAASTLIKIMEESEYKQVTGEQVELEPGQALVFQAKQKNYGYDTIELGNQTYEVKKWNTDKKSYILDEKTQVYETMTVVTRNMKQRKRMQLCRERSQKDTVGNMLWILLGMLANRSQLEMRLRRY